jgi:hypothetical protein
VLILIGRDLKTCEVSIYSDAFDNSEQISLSKETCRGQKVPRVSPKLLRLHAGRLAQVNVPVELKREDIVVERVAAPEVKTGKMLE